MPISSSIVNWITMAVTDRAPYVLDPSPILCHKIVVNIFPSALKHGIEPDDAMYVGSIRFATSCCVRTPSRSCIWVYHRTAFPGGGGGRHIEGPALIHAMRMRTQYVKLLEGGRQWT